MIKAAMKAKKKQRWMEGTKKEKWKMKQKMKGKMKGGKTCKEKMKGKDEKIKKEDWNNERKKIHGKWKHKRKYKNKKEKMNGNMQGRKKTSKN